MSSYYANLQETGDIIVERHVDDTGGGFHRKPPATSSASAAIFGGAGGNGSAITLTLPCENWSVLARKSCINRLDGNRCWARYCACDDCQPRVRRDSSASNASNASSGSGGGGYCSNCGSCCDAYEVVTVTDEQLQASYEVVGLRQNELPIKGTYIDPRIIPGFTYRVRYLCAPSWQQQQQPQLHHQRLVFPKPVQLLSIGAGYGKRLTFDTKDLKGSPAGHFWSDSCPDGYALSLVALDTGRTFSLHTRGGQELGRVSVTWVAPEPAECWLKVGAESITIRVAVAFRASVSVTACRCLLGCHDYEDVSLTGLVWLERPNGSRSVAKVTRVEGVHLPDMPDLKLVPLD